MNKIETIVLKNGLTLYLYQDPRRHSTFFELSTNCGGMTKHFIYDDQEYHLPDGVAHLLEHYVVECNDNGNFLEKLGQKQMSTNASTSPFVTNFYFEAVEDVLYGIRTMLDGIYHVTFDEEKMNKIKKPIYQEVRGKFDNKFYQANRHRIPHLFNHIDFIDVGGTLEEVKSVTIQELEAFYHAFYQPKNQFLVIAGNFSKEEVLKEIEDFYDSLNIDFKETKLIPYEETVDIVKEKGSITFPTPLDYVEITFKIDISSYSPSRLLDLDFYLKSFYSSSFGTTSPLYKQLVDEKVIHDGIRCADLLIDHFLLISIGAYTTNKKRFKDSIFQEIQGLEHLDEEKFEIDKKNSIVQMILREENIFRVIMPFINNVVYFHYPYMDKIEDIEKLTYSDYVDMIHSLDFSRFTYFEILQPKK